MSRWYTDGMKTITLDASQIDPELSVVDFFRIYYQMEETTMPQIRRAVYMSQEVTVTEVFNWTNDNVHWKDIFLTLESLQQHCANFYVIWGPETEDARLFEIEKETAPVPPVRIGDRIEPRT